MNDDKDLRKKMVDTIQAMLEADPEFMGKFMPIFQEIFNSKKIPFTITHLEAFLQGIAFSYNKDEGVVGLMTALVMREIEIKKEALKNINVE